jgi:hypothetical protein
MIESAQKMCKSSDPLQSEEQPLAKWLEFVREEKEVPNDFDVVIMNPPFTRRERIPVKKEDLEKLMPEVKGKTGYWAYFVVAADKVLKENGTLAIVIPEEFFVGRSAQSVREYLFSKGYQVHYVIRSSKEVAFSEGAHYRDYLIVMSRKPQIVPLTIVILKKSMKDITDIQGTCDKIKKFSSSLLEKLITDEFDAIKVHNIRETTKKHIENLKPLIGFNTIKTTELTLELLDDLRDAPTLGDLERNQQIKIRDYNPGQYKTRGVESFARKLFISKYCPKGSKVVFLFDSKYSDKLCIKVKGSQLICLIPLGACAISLRTPSGVRHMDISDEEEAVIINPDALENEILKFAGLLPRDKVYEAARDIKYAYEDLSGNILIARRARLTSNNLFWLAFWSKNRIIGPSAPLINVQVKDIAFAKSLTLYFNSTISLLQLIAFSAETEGAWVALHGKQVWSHLHVPLPENVIEEKISKLFGELGKVDVKPLFSRIKKHDFIQRSLDELALEMLRLDAWKSRLDEIYDAVTKELEAMHKILETSRKQPKKAKVSLEKTESSEKKLDVWIK